MTQSLPQGASILEDGGAARVDRYLRNGMLALWARHGWDDARGGWHERLDPDHAPVELGYRRLTTCARQLFVFSTAAKLQLIPGAREVAQRTFRYLVERFRDREHGGWIFNVDMAGEPIDASKDLYAHAFVLLALPEYAALSADREAADLIGYTGAAVERFLLTEGWYAATAGPDFSIRDRALVQNPHMHLLEAYLAAYAITGRDIYRDRVLHLLQVFATRLFDREAGIIREFRDSSGEPDPQRGHIVEPGHHFEWAWLLDRAAAVAYPAMCHDGATRLFDWALAHGIDRHHEGVFDQVAPEGRVIAETKRLWPQAEYIKARAARLRRSADPGERSALLAALDVMFAAYLASGGGWRERLRRDLTCYDDQMPATSCYHILLSLLEARAALSRAPAAR